MDTAQQQLIPAAPWPRRAAQRRVLEDLLGAEVIGTSPPRFQIVGFQVHIKRLREDPAWRYVDQFCELLVTKLGIALEMPVLPLRLVPAETRGPCLVSQYVGTQGYDAIERDEASISGLLALAGFEEWVMNVDDKPDHFRAVARRRGPKFVLLDHGHSLHSWRADLESLAQVTSNPKVFQPSSSYKPYGVQHVADLEIPIALIKGVSDSWIGEAISETFDDYDSIPEKPPELQSFLTDRVRHEDIVKAILATRRENLDAILETKYP